MLVGRATLPRNPEVHPQGTAAAALLQRGNTRGPCYRAGEDNRVFQIITHLPFFFFFAFSPTVANIRGEQTHTGQSVNRHRIRM